ncbi:DUF3466 family protein [Thalassotalea euphylliae]|uniref:DUF3466 family protein n=1 Tax=Thalassotalea euphylliae TaxID=1655234 RepID=A0A3E0TQN5_9GAMM|nr:DUF3466 family protein [Thalassotalea euphylliae]REL26916.1 DUF3466 family protein [Thalassotalea euphylliae]
MKSIMKSLVALSVTSALSAAAVNAATYEVVDLGEVNSLKFSYGQQVNNLGESAVQGTDSYNLPVQFQYLDEDDYDTIVNNADRTHELVNNLEDIEDEAALRAGNPTANDLVWVTRFLEGQGSSRYQKIGDTVAMINRSGQSEEFVVFDTPFTNTSTLTRSTIDFINGITDNGWVYGNGSAPYLPLDFTESDGDEVTHWVRDFATRAFISTDYGQTIKPILAPETRFYNGQSAILDIKGTTAVGYVSNRLNQNRVDDIEDETGGCADPNIVDDIPFEVCVQNLSSDLYFLTAYQWDLDSEGNVVGETDLGLLVTPNESDERVYRSYAQAINANGVAVGFSHGWIDETETSPSQNEPRRLYPVVYKNGEVTSLVEDHGEVGEGRAYDINDNGIAVGYVTRSVNGSVREKFYHIDTNAPAGDMTMIFPDDFFNGSSSTAFAINNAGLIVGEGEFETQNSTSQRRTHGFLYDINNETFTDLNDFLTCNSDYTIIEARDINDNNEISATAVVKVPRRDAKGELMLSDSGEQLVEDVVRAVTLRPISGDIEDCTQVSEDRVERKGAGLGAGLLAMLSVFGFRRKRNR